MFERILTELVEKRGYILRLYFILQTLQSTVSFLCFLVCFSCYRLSRASFM